MKHAPVVARTLLGLIYFVFGLNGFLNFIPPPPNMPEAAMGFFSGLMSTGYFLPFLKGVEVICGFLLVSGLSVPLALVILAPVTIHIFLFHFFLTPGVENIVMPAMMAGLHIYLGYFYRERYKPMLCNNHAPQSNKLK